ncbi:MAG: FISUMP domain-containing protein [Flavobacteriaceae bacterium]
MKKLLLLSALLIFACSSDDEGNPCVYEPTLTTQAVTDVTETSATLNGVISIVSENCEVPNNTEQGFVYSTEIQPTLEDTQVNVNGTNISTTIEGLTPNTTYYVRAFLTNNFGDFYGDEISFMTEEEITGSCDGAPYPSIVYGTQEWTVENACHITYTDGTPIPEVTDETAWQNLTTGAWCYYENDPTKHRLYNWYAVYGVHDAASFLDPSLRKKFAPEGWHAPFESEWTTLTNYLIANGYNYDGTTTGNKIAKSMASTTGWDYAGDTYEGVPGNLSPNTNNSSGFNAIPEGKRSLNGVFSGEGGITVFASYPGGIIDFVGTSEAYFSRLSANSQSLSETFRNFRDGISVRFVRDSEVDPDDIDNDNDGYSVNQGDCDDTNNEIYPGATEIEDCIDNDCDGEVDEGFNQSGTVTDIDGNTYDSLTYGCQVWTVENADMVTYRDGTPIPEVTDNTTWKYLTTGAWCYYDNDPTKPRLYNWYAVMGIHDTDPNTPNKEFAPEGWHVPSDAEWTTLEEYLIANGYNYDGTTTGNKLAKSMASTTGWNNYTSGVTNGFPSNDQSLNNSSGFNAIPEGGRESFQGGFIYMGQIASAYFWSSTESGTSHAAMRQVEGRSNNLFRDSFNPNQWGFSVRFVKD